MAVTLRAIAQWGITSMARQHRTRRDDSLLKHHGSHRSLEGRSGRIRPHDGTIEEWLAGILHQKVVIFAKVFTLHHTGIITRSRHETKDFARLGLNHDDRATLALHQLFGELLQLYVDTERQVVSRHCLAV